MGDNSGAAAASADSSIETYESAHGTVKIYDDRGATLMPDILKSMYCNFRGH